MNEKDKDDEVLAQARPDGKTDTYFGGSDGKPDGEGHGHVVTTEEGEVVYTREAEQHLPDTTRDERVDVDE